MNSIKSSKAIPTERAKKLFTISILLSLLTYLFAVLLPKFYVSIRDYDVGDCHHTEQSSFCSDFIVAPLAVVATFLAVVGFKFSNEQNRLLGIISAVLALISLITIFLVYP